MNDESESADKRYLVPTSLTLVALVAIAGGGWFFNIAKDKEDKCEVCNELKENCHCPPAGNMSPAKPLSKPKPLKLSLYKREGFKYEASLRMSLSGDAEKKAWEIVEGKARFEHAVSLEWEGEVIKNDGEWYVEKRYFTKAETRSEAKLRDFGLTPGAKSLIAAIQIVTESDPTVLIVTTALTHWLDYETIKEELSLVIPEAGVKIVETAIDELIKQDKDLKRLEYNVDKFERLEDSEVEIKWYKGKVEQITSLSSVELEKYEKELASKMAGFVDYNLFPVEGREVGDAWEFQAEKVIDYFAPAGFSDWDFKGNMTLRRRKDFVQDRRALVTLDLDAPSNFQAKGVHDSASIKLEDFSFYVQYGTDENPRYVTKAISSGSGSTSSRSGTKLFGVTFTGEPHFDVVYRCEEQRKEWSAQRKK